MEKFPLGGTLRDKGSADLLESSLPQSVPVDQVPSYSVATTTVFTSSNYQDSFPTSQPSAVFPRPLETSSTISDEGEEEHSERHRTQSDVAAINHVQFGLASPQTRGDQSFEHHMSGDQHGGSPSSRAEGDHDETFLSSMFSGLEFPEIALSYPVIRNPVQVEWFESGMSNSSRAPSLSTGHKNGVRTHSPVEGSPPIIEGEVGGSSQWQQQSSSEEEELTDVSRLSIVSNQVSEQQLEEDCLKESEGFEYREVKTQVVR